MGVKIFKAVWFLSMLVVLANLLYVYAGLPAEVVVQDEGGSLISIGRDGFFYASAALVGLINALVFAIANVFRKDPDFRSWFYGLVICLNFFFVITFNFISVYNSGDKFDYSKIEFLIFGSIALFTGWALGWPVYSLLRKRFTKSSL
jgi:hypothetical protein